MKNFLFFRAQELYKMLQIIKRDIYFDESYVHNFFFFIKNQFICSIMFSAIHFHYLTWIFFSIYYLLKLSFVILSMSGHSIHIVIISICFFINLKIEKNGSYCLNQNVLIEIFDIQSDIFISYFFVFHQLTCTFQLYFNKM